MIRSMTVAALLALFVAQAQAAPLNLINNLDTPDVAAFDLVLNHNAATNNLTIQNAAASSTLQYNEDDVPPTIDSAGTYSIDATVLADGTLVGGTFELVETFPARFIFGGGTVNVGPPVTLLSGTIVAFGFSEAPGTIFEFVVNLNGGDVLTAAFGGAGEKLNIIFSPTPTVDLPDVNPFGADLGPIAGRSDNFFPTPTTMAMLVPMTLAALTRRRTARRTARRKAAETMND